MCVSHIVWIFQATLITVSCTIECNSYFSDHVSGFYMTGMVTAAIEKELQSAVEVQKREPLHLLEVIRKKSLGGGDN